METEDRYEITWLVRRLFRAMGNWSNDSLKGFGITAADRAVLEFLYPEQALSVPEIASRYNVSRQHVQVTVNRLEEKGLLAGKANPRHKRSPLIVLTRSGRTLFERVRARDVEMIDRIYEGIPDSRQRATRKTLGELLARFNEGELQ
jgi:DNA-binding MarR family transcriptional regulator